MSGLCSFRWLSGLALLASLLGTGGEALAGEAQVLLERAAASLKWTQDVHTVTSLEDQMVSRTARPHRLVTQLSVEEYVLPDGYRHVSSEGMHRADDKALGESGIVVLSTPTLHIFCIPPVQMQVATSKERMAFWRLGDNMLHAGFMNGWVENSDGMPLSLLDAAMAPSAKASIVGEEVLLGSRCQIVGASVGGGSARLWLTADATALLVRYEFKFGEPSPGLGAEFTFAATELFDVDGRRIVRAGKSHMDVRRKDDESGSRDVSATRERVEFRPTPDRKALFDLKQFPNGLRVFREDPEFANSKVRYKWEDGEVVPDLDDIDALRLLDIQIGKARGPATQEVQK